MVINRDKRNEKVIVADSSIQLRRAIDTIDSRLERTNCEKEKIALEKQREGLVSHSVDVADYERKEGLRTDKTVNGYPVTMVMW